LISAKGLLQCSLDSFTKRKCGVCVYRDKDCQVDNAREFIAALAFVDIPQSPISYMYCMINQAFGPIAKSTNTGQFPKAVGTDIIGTMSDISASFYVMLHKSQGMVARVIPPSELLHTENSSPRLHAFEAQVVQWVEETRTLLSQQFPDKEETLTPLDEVKFWPRHRQNLDLLKKQMQFEAVQMISETVKKSSPAFPEQFTEIEKEVDEQLDLAMETERSLHPLHIFLEQIDTVSEGLDALQDKFEPI
jgi:hypothetical protein